MEMLEVIIVAMLGWKVSGGNFGGGESDNVRVISLGWLLYRGGESGSVRVVRVGWKYLVIIVEMLGLLRLGWKRW